MGRAWFRDIGGLACGSVFSYWGGMWLWSWLVYCCNLCRSRKVKLGLWGRYVWFDFHVPFHKFFFLSYLIIRIDWLDCINCFWCREYLFCYGERALAFRMQEHMSNNLKDILRYLRAIRFSITVDVHYSQIYCSDIFLPLVRRCVVM